MKTKLFLSGAVLGLLLAAGCSTDNEKIYFTSEPNIPAPAAEPASLSKSLANTLSKADEEKIDLVIFGYLLERHFWEDGDYSALFLQADDKVVATMMKKFPRHQPPIKPSYHIDLRANQSPLDKDTGRPVMILGVDANDPDADGVVAAIGRWYAGAAVQGYYTFTLKKTGDDWAIVRVK